MRFLKIMKSRKFKKMMNRPKVSNWEFGEVDENTEHFYITFGNEDDDDGFMSRPVIARIGRDGNSSLIVKLLTDDEVHGAPLEREIRQYINELPKKRQLESVDDIWKYLKYHCTTLANLYGNCHWYFKKVD